jgi:chemotaxis protein MotB
MPSKLLAVLGLSAGILASAGCASNQVSKADYDLLKAHNENLERENNDLRKFKSAYEKLKNEEELISIENRLLEDLRLALLDALKGMKVETGDVQFDSKNNKWTLAGDLLFDSGSFKMTAKGEEVLKKFAETYKSKGVSLKIVGHTDRDPIAKINTKQILQFDHNIELGALRAISVFMTLSKFGFAQGRMFVESMGNNQPIAPNDNKTENKKKNRRVEIFVVADALTPERR